MSCEGFRQLLLDFGWDEPARSRASALLSHLDSCSACRDAAGQFDRLREVLDGFQTDADPAGGWTAFEQRMTTRGPHRPKSQRTILAIAASILIAGISFELGTAMINPGRPTAAILAPAMPSEAPSFAPQQIGHDVNAFDQVSKVLDGRASWMLVSDQASDVGVAPRAVPVARHVLLLRLTMLRGQQVASDADLLVVPGQTANLTVPLGADHSLHYRIGTSTEEPTRLAIWLELNSPHGGEPLAALSTNLQVEPGHKFTAGQLATSAGQYELKIGFAHAEMPGARP